MDHKDTVCNPRRLLGLAGFLGAVLLVYVGVLYNTQITHYDEYMAKSIRTIAKEERVEASRGIITDRNGKVLVSNRSTYNLTFDTSLLKDGQDANAAILRLVELCRSEGVDWTDNLPISREQPFTFAVDTLSDVQKSRFLTYLKNLTPAKKALGAYLLAHPDLVGESAQDDSADNGEDPAKAQETRANALVKKLETEDLTEALLTGADISADQLLSWMREDFGLADSFSLSEARLILGVQYELSIRKLINTTAYVLAEDISNRMISLINDGGYDGAKVTSSSAREYETDYAAHLLGYVGVIWPEEYQELKDKGYTANDQIGRSGVESAFESYLKGTDGYRVISTNNEGKITGEFWSKEPQPGNTVELTLDLDLQQTVEDALAETVSNMNAKDGITSRGAGAAVVGVGTGEVLALASYPTYQLSSFNKNYTALSSDPAKPLTNRATQGTYAPGSTFKPLTAIAALTEGVITPTQTIYSPRTWYYPGDRNSYANCWYPGVHGTINISQALTLSCNYFFAEMGYRLGLDRLNQYAKAFGLGEHTGIEIGDAAGTLAENKAGENQSPWAGFGQASYLFTPLQLSNYIATLVSGGKHYDAHLLKSAKDYTSGETVAVGAKEPRNVIEISNASLQAVKKGMYNYTQPGGMVYEYFKSCIVSAGAKTGTAQISKRVKNNGVFVCFAPYEDPEIAVAIVIEKAEAGAALASTAVKILNAYFSDEEIGTAIIGENTLLQ